MIENHKEKQLGRYEGERDGDRPGEGSALPV